MTTQTQTVRTISTIPSKYNNAAYADPIRGTEMLLQFRDNLFGICVTPEGAASRITYCGPLVPGPHVQAFQLAGVIASNPEDGTYGQIRRAKADGTFVELADGDEVEIDGVLYRVASGVENRRDYLRFDRVAR